MVDAIPFELMSIGRAEHFVTSDFRGYDLNHNITVCEAYYEAVFGGIVFVLGLGNETLAGVVIGFTGSATLVFGLIAATW